MSTKSRAIVEQEIILIYVQEKPAFFARVEKIIPDVKKNWWRVSMIVLQVPVKIVTWIIDGEQIQGAEFTMGGIPIRIEHIEVPAHPDLSELDESNSITTPEETNRQEKQVEESPKKARILSLGSNKSS